MNTPYRYKQDSDIDAYGDSQSVIHFKFGDAKKHYNFTVEFVNKYPNFTKEYSSYFNNEPSAFTDPLGLVNYIERHNIPVRLYRNMVDLEFEDIEAAKEWLCREYLPSNLINNLDKE